MSNTALESAVLKERSIQSELPLMRVNKRACMRSPARSSGTSNANFAPCVPCAGTTVGWAGPNRSLPSTVPKTGAPSYVGSIHCSVYSQTWAKPSMAL